MTTLLAASTFHIMYAVPAVALCAPAVGAFLVLSVGRILRRR
jgi:hypothetical protein